MQNSLGDGITNPSCRKFLVTETQQNYLGNCDSDIYSQRVSQNVINEEQEGTDKYYGQANKKCFLSIIQY